jgi:hypothetical protein
MTIRVGRPHVAMNDAELVGMVQSLGGLGDDLG